MEQKKFVVGQKELTSVLSIMQSICSKKTSLPSTQLVLFQITGNELVIKATDLEISLQYSCLLAESDIETLQFLVSGKKIFDILKELDGQVNFGITDTQLYISCGKVNLSLHIKSADEFPPLPERIENLMQVEASDIAEFFSKVSFLIPQNNSNPALNGLFIEISNQGLTMTTTDGHCLAQIKTDKYKLEQSQQWLIPRRGIFEIKKILEGTQDESIFLGTCSNQLVFSGESFNFFTKLLADKFPEYRPIMSKDTFVPAQLSKQDFVKTLRRSSCLLSGQFLATTFKFAPDNLKVELKNQDVGKLEETLPLADFKGDPLEVRFYSPYLLNGLQAFSNDQVSFFLKNNTRPIIFESNQNNYDITYLVMPVSSQANG